MVPVTLILLIGLPFGHYLISRRGWGKWSGYTAGLFVGVAVLIVIGAVLSQTGLF